MFPTDEGFIDKRGAFWPPAFQFNPNGGELIVPALFVDDYFTMKKGIWKSVRAFSTPLTQSTFRSPLLSGIRIYIQKPLTFRVKSFRRVNHSSFFSCSRMKCTINENKMNNETQFVTWNYFIYFPRKYFID